MFPPTYRKPRAAGFTLTELAVVLLIVGLLLGGLIMPFSTQQDLRARKDTEVLFSDIREALIGFALTHSATDGEPYLPCPDTDDDGSENRTGNACTSQGGRIPWADLGLPTTDHWGNRIRYRVDADFSNNATGFVLSPTPSAGSLSVCASSAGACTGTDKIADSLPAVFVSHSKNGLGAYNSNAGTNAASTDAEELENADNNDKFVYKAPVDNGYDDLTGWLPPGILFNRMVAAGRLP